MDKTLTNITEVVVGVVYNPAKQILIAKRQAHQHLADHWEFPGGKIETGEQDLPALQRELKEELDIDIVPADCLPLTQIEHVYPEKTVRLRVYTVWAFKGEAKGQEGQTIRWVSPNDLNNYLFPAGNQQITRLLQLPDVYAITPDCSNTELEKHTFLEAFERLVKRFQLARLRCPSLSSEAYVALAKQCQAIATQQGCLLLLDAKHQGSLKADGWHYTQRDMLRLSKRPVDRETWCMASVHDKASLHHAQLCQFDGVTLSPVLPTTSHPKAQTIGFAGLQELLTDVKMPVFALGGMQIADKWQAKACGAYGISGISACWR